MEKDESGVRIIKAIVLEELYDIYRRGTMSYGHEIAKQGIIEGCKEKLKELGVEL